MFQHVTCTASAFCRKRRHCDGNLCHIRTDKMSRAQNSQHVLHDMASRHTNLYDCLFAADLDRHA